MKKISSGLSGWHREGHFYGQKGDTHGHLNNGTVHSLHRQEFGQMLTEKVTRIKSKMEARMNMDEILSELEDVLLMLKDTLDALEQVFAKLRRDA